MLTVFSFVFALALLIAVHEYGHYRVAVACGVKVLRFSIGFGPTLLKWQRAGSPTEFVVGAIPLGGYVKMLDEREGSVQAHERHLAFNTQPIKSRAAIVLAGPLANLLLAVCLYFAVSWVGVPEPRAILASPPAQSLAALAGMQGRETIDRIQIQDDVHAIETLEALRWQLLQAALAGQDVQIHGRSADGAKRVFHLPVSRLQVHEVTPELIRQIGITGPWTAPRVGELQPDGAAQRDGLRAGDLVIAVDNTAVVDGAQLRELIRATGAQGAVRTQIWTIQRGEQSSVLSLAVTPEMKTEGDKRVARIGAYIGDLPAMVTVERGFWGSWVRGFEQTTEVSAMTLGMLWKIATGQASVKNLSGPITIADYAGKSAHLGVIPFLLFLALISVSLGVLNLLPLPMLDGGHLMYYLWEAVTGRPVSDLWLDRLQRIGLAVLLLMMSVAMYNDVMRIIG
jgi:regulator of sigma E protease